MNEKIYILSLINDDGDIYAVSKITESQLTLLNWLNKNYAIDDSIQFDCTLVETRKIDDLT